MPMYRAYTHSGNSTCQGLISRGRVRPMSGGPTAGPGTISMGAFLVIRPRVGHLFISAVKRSLVRGATIEHRKSQKSVEWSSKVIGQKPALTQVYVQSFLEPLRLSIRN